MNKITYIKAAITSISPLYIGDDEGELLLDYENNKTYLPATGVAGSFRAYLMAVGEDYKSLFGDQEGKKSSIYISDAFSDINALEKRDGLKIDKAMGSNEHGKKMDMLYFGEGLRFDLIFEIHAEDYNALKYKKMLYKCLNALDKTHIRFGGKKSSGLGNFKLVSVNEIELSLNNIVEYEKYLKRDFKDSNDVITAVKNTEIKNSFMGFKIKGNLSTPLLIKAPDSFELNMPDGVSLKSGKHYIVPGSSFKGILRARMETIGDYFGNKKSVNEIFGDIPGDKEKHVLSRIIVSESKISGSKHNDKAKYNRIKVDKFTGGVRKTGLMNDKPVIGEIEFKIMYKKTGDKKADDYAIGILSLALRDLGTENLTLGGGSNIGRGRFKASYMNIADEDVLIEIDFKNKKIKGEEKLQKYIDAAKYYRYEVKENGKQA